MIDSIYSRKIEVRNSEIHGRGTFAKKYIEEGEILFVKSGHLLKRGEEYSRGQIDCYWPIGDTFVLGAKNADECDRIKLFINHSCNPNCGLKSLNAGIAMRDIAAEEEITFDYATLDDEDYQFNCSCGSTECRGTVTGFDWKHPELQSKYKGYFVQYLQEKIDAGHRAEANLHRIERY